MDEGTVVGDRPRARKNARRHSKFQNGPNKQDRFLADNQFRHPIQQQSILKYHKRDREGSCRTCLWLEEQSSLTKGRNNIPRNPKHKNGPNKQD